MICGNFFKAHLLTASVTKPNIATSGLHVFNPANLVTEHGYEIAFASDDSHDHRQAEDAARLPPDDAQSDQVVRSDSQGVERRGPSVDKACDAIGTSTAVQPPR